MKTIKNPFSVQYRLTMIMREQSKPKHIYGTDRRKLKRMATSRDNVCYLTLYKRGPLGLPERPVDWGERSEA